MHVVLALTLLLSAFQRTFPSPILPGLSPDLYNTQAPELHAKSIDGKEISLTSLRGRYVLLDFWGVGCAPCRDALPSLEAIHRDYKDRGLVILGIDVGEDQQTVEGFLKTTPASYPIVIDKGGDVQKLFHVFVIPTYILIDPTGKMVDGHGGFLKALSDSQENGESQLRGMLRRIMGN
jgi:thiol-disulfide isomerase/thioredoxin